MIGRACVNCCGVIGWATAWTGREAIIAAAGTDVAAPRLMYVLVTFVMLVTLVTWLTFTSRT